MTTRRRIPWKTLSTKTVYKNPWFHVTESKVIRPDGKPGTYNVVHTRGGSASAYVIAIDARGRFLIHLEYRFPTKVWSWGLPGGGVEQGEPPLTSAKRELLEEADLRARRWSKLGELQAMTGIVSEWMHIFLAKELVRATSTIHPGDEQISDKKWVSFDQALRMIKRGELHDSQSIAAIILAGAHLKKI